MKKSTSLFFFLIISLFCLSTYAQTAKFTADKFSGCAPITVNFTDQSTGGASSWNWDFGNSNFSTKQHPSAIYNNPGTYTVRLTINGGSTVTHTIIVFQSPTATFILDNDSICLGGTINLTSTSTAGSAPIKTYIWSFGDGTKDTTTGSSVSHTYSVLLPPGPKTINLIVNDTNKCDAASQNVNVYLIAAPVAKFIASPSSSCSIPVSVNFINQTTPPATTYQWTFGDPSSGPNNISSIASPSHTYTATGQYTIVLTAQTGNCSTSDSIIFYARPIVANFSAGNDTFCLNSPAVFTNTSNPPPATAQWNFGDVASGSFNTSTLINPSHSFSAPGTYSVSLVALNAGCVDSIRKTVVVMPAPIIGFTITGDSNFCKPPATINFQSAGVPPLVWWNWYFEDTLIVKDITSSPSYTFTKYGSFPVRLIAKDIYGCIDTATKLNYINIIAPTVDIVSPPDSGCSGKLFSLTRVVTLAPGDSVAGYLWNYGDGSPLDTSSKDTVTHIYNSCKIDTVSLMITTTKGCSDTTVKDAWIRTGIKPTVGFNWHPDTTCYGEPAFFSDTSLVNGCKITAWNWTFVSIDSTTQTAFPDTGYWGAGLTVYSNGCDTSVYKDSIVYVLAPKPILTFLNPTCADHFTIQFADSSHGADSLLWDFGDTLSGAMDTSTLKNPVHVFTKRGTYLIQLHAWNFTTHCDYIDTGMVVITDPKAIITGNPQGCHPFILTDTGSTSVDAVIYSWNFGDPGSGVLDSSTNIIPPPHTYAVPGTYMVTLIITDIYGCKDTATQIISSVGPTASFNAITLKGCRQLTDTFTSTSIPEGSPITSYLWNFNYPLNDTATSFSNSISHTFTQNGFYTIRLVVTDANGCSDDTILTNYIEVTFPDPQFNNIDTFVCDHVSVPFSVSGNGTAPFTYHWSFGDNQPDSVISNSSSSISTVNHTYLFNDTTFKLSVTVTDANGCDSTISQNILILRPSAKFVPHPVDLCPYTTLTFDSLRTDSITTWLWTITDPGGFTNNSTDQHPSFTFTTPGTYSSALTVTNPGCTDTYTVGGIVVPPFPIAAFTFDSLKRCPPSTVTFTSHILNGEPYKYIEWDFADGNIVRQNYPDSIIRHIYYAGSYTPSAKIYYTLPNGTICFRVDTNLSGNFTVFSVFSVNITQDSIVIKEGKQDTLTSFLTTVSSVPPYIYTWNTYANGVVLPIYNTTGAIYTAMENDTMVVLTVRDANGCETYDTVFIDVKLCEVNLKIPNVFTPNGDNLNEYYYINDLCDIDNFKFTIWNRWGSVVYESSHYDFHWNGKDNNGKECSEGVYYYIIHGKRKDLYGYIHLIRN